MSRRTLQCRVRHLTPTYVMTNELQHIDIVEKQISKSIVALYKAKFVLDQKCLKHIYFAFIHSYINYANIA